MNLTTNSKVHLTTKGEINASTNNNNYFTFSFGKEFHITVWKILFPLVLLVTLCACVLHWVGVL
jgi:hypothetical protein